MNTSKQTTLFHAHDILEVKQNKYFFKNHFLGDSLFNTKKINFGENDSLKLANDLFDLVQDYSKLSELYISFIINRISLIIPPKQIGLVGIPPQCKKIECLNFKTNDFQNIDEIWNFISNQIEIISSFQFDGEKIISSNTNRRRSGTYETPPLLADALAELLLENLINTLNKKCDNKEIKNKNLILDKLVNIRILDPACGTGRLLYYLLKKIEAYIMSENEKGAFIGDIKSIRRHYINNCIYGVDQNPIAVKATKFLFWLYSLDKNAGTVPDIRTGNSLIGQTFKNKQNGLFLISEDKHNLFNWNEEYPNLDGFDMIITNPPWEKLKIIARESLDVVNLTAPTKAEMDTILKKEGNGDIRKELEKQREIAKKLSIYFRNSGDYPFSSKGDINLYALFTERCKHLLNLTGIAGLIIPSGIVTDYHLKNLLYSFVKDNNLLAFHDFMNKKKYFSQVDGRYRYCFFVFSSRSMFPHFKFSCYNIDPKDITKSSFSFSKEQIKVLNPLTNTLIVPKNPSIIPLMLRIHKEMPILSGDDGADIPWRINYKRQADMTNDSHLFISTEDMNFDDNNPGILKKENEIFFRLYEGKMVDIYNHRAGSSATKIGQYKRSGHSIRPTQKDLENPNFLVTSRYAISKNDLKVNKRLQGNLKPWHLAFKDITAATNRRTVRAAILPTCVVSNKLPTLEVLNGEKEEACLLGVLNSLIFDFLCRQKIGNITLNWFILRQIPIPPLHYFYEGTVEGENITDWLVSRIIKLMYTSFDLLPWSKAIDGPLYPFPWEESERVKVGAEIDSLMFHLYKLSKKEVKSVMEEFPHMNEDLILSIYDKMEINIP